MKKAFRILGWSLLGIVGLAIVAYGIAWGIAKSRYEKQWVAHDGGLPDPIPVERCRARGAPC